MPLLFPVLLERMDEDDDDAMILLVTIHIIVEDEFCWVDKDELSASSASTDKRNWRYRNYSNKQGYHMKISDNDDLQGPTTSLLMALISCIE